MKRTYYFLVLVAASALTKAAHVNTPMPYYFSGTACRAVGGLDSIPVEGYPNVMNLYIGGQLAAHYEGAGDSPFRISSDVAGRFDIGPKILSTPRALSVIFDSTHFANGTSLVIFFEAWTNTGYFSASGSASVMNEATLFGRYDFEVSGTAGQRGIPTVESALTSSQVHYDGKVNTTQGWTSSNFYNDIEIATSVVYIHTHGESSAYVPNPPVPNPPDTWFQADFDEIGGSPSSSEYTILANSNSLRNVLLSREVSMGSGYWPYNSSHKPPIWIAFNDGCRSGNDNAFAEGYLWPYYNSYDANSCEDQCEMGWTIYKTSDQTKPCAEAFWFNMRDGWDADWARLRLYDAYQGANKPPGSRDLVHVYGDWYARLHGVWTGQAGQVTGWHS